MDSSVGNTLAMKRSGTDIDFQKTDY